MTRAFKIRSFQRWARKAGLDDRALWFAVQEMSAGLIDADLGGGLVKKRIAMPGRGKRGGARALVATNRGDRWVFLAGFQKNEAEDLSSRTLESLKEHAGAFLSLDAFEIQAYLQQGVFIEVPHA